MLEPNDRVSDKDTFICDYIDGLKEDLQTLLLQRPDLLS